MRDKLGRRDPVQLFPEERKQTPKQVGARDVDDAASGVWKEIGAATGIGARRLLPVPATTTTKVRFRMVEASACPALTEVGLYVQPRFK